MRQCSECGRWCHGTESCSRCGEQSGDRPSQVTGVHDVVGETWAVIARFGNAAEAGYFADELDYALGFEPRLECRDDFDAVHHHWQSRFVLSVPPHLADQAREVLTCLVDGANSESPTRENLLDAGVALGHLRRNPPRESTWCAGANVKWAPLFLTLAAGSLVIWQSKKPPAQLRPILPQDALRIQFADAPGLDDAPWVQRVEGGMRRELHFPRHAGDAVLREDRDGDGIFEREYTLKTQ